MPDQMTPDYEAFVRRKRKEFERAGRKYGLSAQWVAMDVLAVLTPDDEEVRVSIKRKRGKR